MQTKTPTLWGYLCDWIIYWPGAWRRGAIVMTAIVTAILVLALFVGWQAEYYPTAAFLIGAGIIAAIDIFFVWPFQVWKINKSEILALEERIRPKLKCYFSMDDVGCVRPNTKMTVGGPSGSSAPTFTLVSTSSHFEVSPWNSVQVPMNYYRIRVDVDGVDHVENCRGRLEWVKKDGVTIVAGEPTTLPFAPSENKDAVSKTIHGNSSEFLDLLYIKDNNEVRITSYQFYGSSSIDWLGLFATPGEYRMKVQILSDGPTVGTEILFSWTGDRKTATLRQIQS